MKVLFIGNSYTYYHDMPIIFEKLARENGYTVEVFSVTAGGRYLKQNLDSEDVCTMRLNALLQEHHFDVCILQEQSTYPIRDLNGFLRDVTRLANAVSPSVNRFVLYSTWGRQFGAKFLEESGLTSDAMADMLAAAYKQATDVILGNLKKSAVLSPVGTTFSTINRLGTVELYAPDLSHPSYEGSCLAAFVHYHTIFGKLPVNTDSLQLSELAISAYRSAVDSL